MDKKDDATVDEFLDRGSYLKRLCPRFDNSLIRREEMRCFLQLGWTAKRELSKINYRIHTDAIKSHLIPKEVTPAQANIIYAEEADVLNVAMFGMTAKQWREANPDLKGILFDIKVWR